MIHGDLPQTVRDVRGGEFTLVRQVGAGGQGTVFAVEGDRFAVKVLGAQSQTERIQLGRKLRTVKLQPLQDLRLARPLELLAPPLVGYVMELVDAGEPLAPLMKAPEDADPLRWFSDSGGLRRRYELARSAVETITALHSLGLMYGDLSPANVLVDSEAEGEAWLIDTDNIRPEGTAGDTVFTRAWAAPELVRLEHPPSSLTDVWAAGVLTFHLLALTHPFLGDAVADGPPEFEDDAFAGLLPWVDDPGDTSNRSTDGLPRDFVLTGRLASVYGQLFGAGRESPIRRPGAGELLRELTRASRLLTDCDQCRLAMLMTRRRVCPFCSATQGPRVLGRLWTRERVGTEWIQNALDDRVLLDDGRPTRLPRSMVLPTGGSSPGDAVELMRSGDGISLRLLSQLDVEVEGVSHGSPRGVGDEVRFRLAPTEQRVIRFGDLSASHRALVIGTV